MVESRTFGNPDDASRREIGTGWHGRWRMTRRQHGISSFYCAPACVDARRTTSELLRNVREPVKRSEEHTSELQSLMRISYAVFCLKKKKKQNIHSSESQEHQP